MGSAFGHWILKFERRRRPTAGPIGLHACLPACPNGKEMLEKEAIFDFVFFVVVFAHSKYFLASPGSATSANSDSRRQTTTQLLLESRNVTHFAIWIYWVLQKRQTTLSAFTPLLRLSQASLKRLRVRNMQQCGPCKTSFARCSWRRMREKFQETFLPPFGKFV